MKFRLEGWDYFYFCTVYVKNYSVVHLCFLHCLFPYLHFELSARTERLHHRECMGGGEACVEERPGLLYWIYTLS